MKHQKTVSRMIKSAAGSTGLLHTISKPTTWRRRGQILKEEEEDAKPLARCEEKRKEWAKHWQCGKAVQDQKNRAWRSEELKKLEEDMPRLIESDLDKASRLRKAKTGVGCGGFHPKVPLDLTREARGEVVEFLAKVEQCGNWRQQTCTTMFFLIPKNVTSERQLR